MRKYNQKGMNLLIEAITVQAIHDYRHFNRKYKNGTISPYDKHIYDTACTFLFEVIPSITSMDVGTIKRGIESQRPTEKNIKPRANRR